MGTIRLFGVLHKSIDTITKSKKTSIDITSLIFSLIAFHIKLLRTSQINDEKFAMGWMSIVKTVNWKFKNCMGTRWKQVGICCSWSSFGYSVAN